MPLTIGGIQLSMGMDISQVMKGANEVEGMLKGFKQRLTAITLEGIVKGNPFLNQANHLKEMSKLLNKVFKNWAMNVTGVDSRIEKSAQNHKVHITKIVQEYERLVERVQTLRKASVLSLEPGAGRIGDQIKLEDPGEGGAGPDTTNVAKTLEPFRIFGEEARILIDGILQGIREGKFKTKDEMELYFSELRRVIAREGQPVLSEFRQIGVQLESSMKRQEALAHRANVTQASSPVRVRKQMIEASRALQIAERKLNAEIRAGMHATDGYAKKMKLFQDAQNNSVRIGKRRTAELKRYRDGLAAVQHQQALVTASDPATVKTGVLEATRSLELAEAKLNAEVKFGINVTQEATMKIKMYEKALAAGVSIGARRTAELKKYHAELKKLSYITPLKEAGSTSAARQRMIAATKKLHIAENKLNAEIKIGMHTTDAAAKRIQLYNNALAEGARLSSRRSAILQKHTALQKADTAATQRANAAQKEQSILSGFRLGWFLKLRALWGVYRGATDAVRLLMDFETQRSRALRTATSETKSLVEMTELYSKAMRDAAKKHGSSFEESGEVLYQLGSAGLSAEEALAGLDSTLSLIIATEGDARETTKAVAGMYNLFGETLGKTRTEAEKFAHINDVIANIWKNHQVEIGELAEGYSRLGAVAKVAGISFEDAGAYLAVAGDHMIKSGKAGRAIVSVWSRMTRDIEGFADTFGIEVDPSEMFDFNDIMEKLNEKFKETGKSADWLGDAFTKLGLRGAPVFITLLENFQKVKEAQQQILSADGEAVKLEKIRLDNIEGKWKLFTGQMSSYVSHLSMGLKDLATALLGAGGAFDKFIKERERALQYLNMSDKELGLRTKVGMLQSKMVFLSFFGINIESTRAEVDGILKEVDRLKKIRMAEGLDSSKHEAWRLKGRGGKTTTEIEDAKTRATYDTDAEKAYYRAKRTDDRETRLAYLKEDIEKTIAERNRLEKIAKTSKAAGGVKVAKDGTKISESVGKKYKSATEAQEALNKLTGEQKKLLAEIAAELKSIEIARINQLQKGNAITAETFDLEIKRLKIGGTTAEEFKRINVIEEARYELNVNNAELEKSRAIANKEDAKNYERTYQNALDRAEAERIINLELNDRARVQTKLEGLTQDYQEELDIKRQEVALAKIQHKSDTTVLELKHESLMLTRTYLVGQLAVNKEIEGEAERLRSVAKIQKDIRQNNLDILESEEALLRNKSIWYDGIGQLKDKMVDFHKVMTTAIVDFTTGFATGLGSLGYDLFSGFQGAQQEAEDLKGKYGELSVELDEAIGEGNIEDVERLKNEMAGLVSQIEEAEDPLKNLEKGFRDFFKSLIDSIGEAITQWIAMKIVMGVMGAVGGTPINPSIGGPTFVAGTGGILPQIKSFKRFASGGMTGGPMMALLGDNKSGRELVIPSENISENKVSGYVRDGGEGKNITIVNVITEQDFANAMSKESGKKVIVNRVLENINEGGQIVKQLRM